MPSAKTLVDRACETARTGAASPFTAAIDDSCQAIDLLLLVCYSCFALALCLGVAVGVVDEIDVPRLVWPFTLQVARCIAGSDTPVRSGHDNARPYRVLVATKTCRDLDFALAHMEGEHYTRAAAMDSCLTHVSHDLQHPSICHCQISIYTTA